MAIRKAPILRTRSSGPNPSGNHIGLAKYSWQCESSKRPPVVGLVFPPLGNSGARPFRIVRWPHPLIEPLQSMTGVVVLFGRSNARANSECRIASSTRSRERERATRMGVLLALMARRNSPVEALFQADGSQSAQGAG